jgi:hypothetical protein
MTALTRPLSAAPPGSALNPLAKASARLVLSSRRISSRDLEFAYVGRARQGTADLARKDGIRRNVCRSSRYVCSRPPNFCHICCSSDICAALEGASMKTFVCLRRIFVFVGLMLLCVNERAYAQVASIYGGRDGLCGHKTASGERLNCSAMTAAHRKLPFGTNVRVCHSGCVTVRINDRGPWVRGRDLDLSPAAARAIGLYKTGHVTMSGGL